MKTTITITVVKHSEHSTVEVNDAITEAFGEFDRIVKQYTRFNENSELSNLNRRSGEWTTVTSEFLMLIKRMLEISAKSDGAFDPTVIDYLETYGYDPNYDFSKLDNPDLDNHVKKLAETRKSWKEIELNEAESSVKLAAGQRIDLGGIGKGYAIDCAYEKLNKYPDFLIDAGGDIRCKGLNDEGKPWKLNLLHKAKDRSGDGQGDQNLKESLKNPNAGSSIGYVEISDLAIACSGSWARRVKQFHHILDPRTGAPVESMQTVYVSATDATLADSWATALFVAGRDLLGKLPAEMGAILIDEHNKAIIAGSFPELKN
ncbi:MAG: FAD:protein FMN transferase [Candidatus Doudnabacteria bacterium]|nr:FAD:protein FMN transferase [Candidatus Doudnabacteria bacterium]